MLNRAELTFIRKAIFDDVVTSKAAVILNDGSSIQNITKYEENQHQMHRIHFFLRFIELVFKGKKELFQKIF